MTVSVSVRSAIELGSTTVELESWVGVDGSKTEFTHAAVADRTELGNGSSPDSGELGGQDDADTAHDIGAGVGSWAGGVWGLFDG